MIAADLSDFRRAFVCTTDQKMIDKNENLGYYKVVKLV